MRSADELRAEARQLRDAVRNVADPALRQELAVRALDLSIQAEEIARSRGAPDILRMNVARYRSMLAAGIDDAQKLDLVREMLRDAEEMLAQIAGKALIALTGAVGLVAAAHALSTLASWLTA